MKIQEIINIENQNTNTIHLIKQGAFWCVYEFSAFLFKQNIKTCRVISKHYKSLNTELVYCCFPNHSLNNILELSQKYHIQKTDNHIIIKSFQSMEQNFAEWKTNIINQTKETQKVNKYIEQVTESLKELNPHLILLFGSYAYGTPHKDSDIDLLVVTSDDFIPQSFNERIKISLNVKKHIYEINKQVAVDLLVYTKPMYAKFVELQSLFAQEILHNGKILYECNYTGMA